MKKLYNRDLEMLHPMGPYLEIAYNSKTVPKIRKLKVSERDWNRNPEAASHKESH